MSHRKSNTIQFISCSVKAYINKPPWSFAVHRAPPVPAVVNPKLVRENRIMITFRIGVE